MNATTYAGTIYSTLRAACDAYAASALPDPSVIGADEDPRAAAEGLDAYWASEAAKIGEEHEVADREARIDALVRRIVASRRTTAETITDEQIRALRREAREAGDLVQVGICCAALGSDAEPEVTLEVLRVLGQEHITDREEMIAAARAECARVIAEAEAQS